MKIVRRRVVWRVVTLLTIATIGSALSDFEHFTWWSIAWFAIYGTMEQVDLARHAFWFITTVFVVVISGVVLMGQRDCRVFADAYETLGPTRYIIGNFVMHYLPSLIVIALAPNDYILCGEYSVWMQIWTAFATFLIWYQLRDPWAIYGCSLPHEIGPLGMLIIIMAFTILATHLQPE